MDWVADVVPVSVYRAQTCNFKVVCLPAIGGAAAWNVVIIQEVIVLIENNSRAPCIGRNSSSRMQVKKKHFNDSVGRGVKKQRFCTKTKTASHYTLNLNRKFE